MDLLNIYHNEFLKVYYKKIFPTESFCKWLSYDSIEAFSKREFSFTLEGDIYVRYQSFKDKEEFFTELCNKNPHKIDIGAVYNMPPKNNKRLVNGGLLPQWKEFVFDIDMTDYDDIRFCCEKADICNKCWTLMTVAIKVLDRAIRMDFGYENLLWVYSGRRGVHCWVCDKDARELPSNARSAFVEYLTLVKGGNDKRKKVFLFKDTKWVGNMHPFISRSLDIIRPYFSKYALLDQKVLDHDKGIDRVLAMIPEEFCERKDSLSNNWRNNSKSETPQSVTRWKTIVKHLSDEHLDSVTDEIYLEFMYPRLDINVSTGINHLLKSPFSVHPSTGRICVPIDIDSIDEFDPFMVPTVEQVWNEFKLSGDVLSTSLGKYLELFDRFVSDLNINQ